MVIHNVKMIRTISFDGDMNRKKYVVKPEMTMTNKIGKKIDLQRCIIDISPLFWFFIIKYITYVAIAIISSKKAQYGGNPMLNKMQVNITDARVQLEEKRFTCFISPTAKFSELIGLSKHFRKLLQTIISVKISV